MSTDKRKICSGIGFEFGLIADGIAGGDIEFQPYVDYATSFGKHRIMRQAELVKSNVNLKTKPLESKLGADEKEDSKGKEREKVTMFDVSDEIECYRTAEPILFVPDDYTKMRGDETIGFKMFCLTRFSGVESIDKMESKYVIRENGTGLSIIELNDIFHHAIDHCATEGLDVKKTRKITFTLTDKFSDDKIIEEKTKSMLRIIHKKELERYGDEYQVDSSEFRRQMAEARLLTEKATITYTITLFDFDYALYQKSIFGLPNITETRKHAFLPTGERGPVDSSSSSLVVRKSTNGEIRFKPLLYNSKKSWELFLKATNGFLTVYIDHFITTDENHRSKYKPTNPIVSNLQLPQYVSERGKLPLFAYFAADPFYWTYSSEEAKNEMMALYGFNVKSEDYLLKVLRSSLRRHGLKEETFIKAINEHYSPKNDSEYISPEFVLAREVLCKTGTFAAAGAYYTADYRLIIETMQKLYHETGSNSNKEAASEVESTYQKHKHKDVGDVHRCSSCGKELKVRVFDTDSWDRTILNGTTKCDDCEGQDCTATAFIRAYGIGRYDTRMQWTRPAMRAAKKLLYYSSVTDLGALVTSAFMDTNNKVIDLKQEDLPLIDSALDKMSKNAGHCFGLYMSLTRLIRKLKKGNTPKEVIALMEKVNTEGMNKNFLLRDRFAPTLILEGTGNIHPHVLSLEETYSDKFAGFDPEPVQDSLFLKKKAEWLFMKKMKALLKAIEEPRVIKEDDDDETKERKKAQAESESFIELFVGEGLCHYIYKQPVERRTSPFYNSVVHGCSVDAMQRFSVSLSQFAFCRTPKKTYGVRMGELVRDSEKSHISLICPFVGYEAQWINEVLPMVESVQNQMPVISLGRYTTEEYENEIYCRYISPNEISSSFDFDSVYSYTVNSKDEADFMKEWAKIEEPKSNRFIAALYSKTWKLTQSKKKTDNLHQFIRNMPGLVTFAIYNQRDIPVCDGVIVYLCIIDTDICLGFEKEDQKT
jgi:hypothetical protein